MIIIIKGISINDLRSDISSDYKTITYLPVYEKIPKYYHKDTWPDSINIPCWLCREKFQYIPIPIIIEWETKRVKGVFCCPEHAKYYINKFRDNDINQKELKKYTSFLLRFCKEELNMNINYIEDIEDFYMSPEFGHI